VSEDVTGPSIALATASAFGRARREQNYSFCFENRSNPHRDRATRNFFTRREGLAIVLKGLFVQDLQASSRGQARGRFVETHVAIAPDAQDLKIDSPDLRMDFS